MPVDIFKPGDFSCPGKNPNVARRLWLGAMHLEVGTDAATDAAAMSCKKSASDGSPAPECEICALPMKYLGKLPATHSQPEAKVFRCGECYDTKTESI
jgi:hypothetical protein